MEFCKFCLNVFGETLRVSDCNSQTGVSDAAFCRVTVLWRCIKDWVSERYCDYVVCLCVCLSVKPNPNDVLGIRQYIAKYRDITIPLKLNRCKKFAQVSLISTVMFT